MGRALLGITLALLTLGNAVVVLVLGAVVAPAGLTGLDWAMTGQALQWVDVSSLALLVALMALSVAGSLIGWMMFNRRSTAKAVAWILVPIVASLAVLATGSVQHNELIAAATEGSES